MMMIAQTQKTDVLKIRMDSATLQLLEKARHYVELDKSKFIRQSIQEKAQAIIAEHDHTQFNADDWRMFFEMLDNPLQPTERMKKAAKTYQKLSTSII
jgi:uncharacterized protein (DUF1778 family)